VRAGWTTKPIEDACTFINGLWKGEKDPLKTVGVIRNTNFTKDGTLDDTDIAFIEVEVKKFDKRKLFAGDIILEKSGGGPKQAVGRVVLFDKTEGDYSFSNFTAALRVKSPDELDAKYLHKFLHWTYLSGVTEGMQSNSTGIRNLDGDKYKAIQVNYPSIAEQQRIVTLLDETFADIATAKANAEKNLQNARELFESHLDAIVTSAQANGEIVPLSELATDITDGDHMPPPKVEQGLPFITIGNIDKQTRAIDFSDTFQVPREYFDGLKANKKPMRGDVLYTVTGSFGIPVLVKDDKEFCFQRHIGLIRPKADVDSTWLHYMLQSPQVFNQAADGATGTAQKTVSLKVLRNLQVPKISTTQQSAHVETLRSVETECRRLESIYRQKLTALDDLKKSLLHQAFSGQL
jgi:type I restriction enzyme S subunit